MRHLIKGMIAAFAVMTAGAAPASACGWNPCASSYYAPTYTYEQTYVSTPAYSGCGGCGTAVTGYGYEHLAEPTTQYYYVNQGPYYNGPGAFAPQPEYQEDAAPTNYGYGYGYHHTHRPYGYGYGMRHYGYGYAHHPRYYPHHWGYRYGGGEGTYWGHHMVRRYY
jgi:hypothetical protein